MYQVMQINLDIVMLSIYPYNIYDTEAYSMT